MGEQRRIAGRYRLDAKLGEGAMGAVWRARDLERRRDVAVKVSNGPLAPGKRLKARFEREAALTRGIDHPNVVRVLDAGLDDDRPYLVMELLEGEDLDARLARPPKPSVASVITTCAVALEGLAACHDAGVVHRDLKPDNIFLAREGGKIVPKIVDFGVARLLVGPDEADVSLTRSGEMVGTPSYMAPEQTASAKQVTPRSDLYSVGVILYEALTGREPYEWSTLGQLLLAVALEEPTPIVELRPEVGQALSDVVAKAMAKDPADRFADAREMRGVLLACAVDALDEVPASATSLRRRRAAGASDEPTVSAPAPRGPVPVLYIGLAVGIALSVIAAVFAWMG